VPVNSVNSANPTMAHRVNPKALPDQLTKAMPSEETAPTGDEDGGGRRRSCQHCRTPPVKSTSCGGIRQSSVGSKGLFRLDSCDGRGLRRHYPWKNFSDFVSFANMLR
jgi:hypothetical protein